MVLLTSRLRFSARLQSPAMQALRWMRVPGDVLFTLGAALLGWFVLGLLAGRSYRTVLDESRKVEKLQLINR